MSENQNFCVYCKYAVPESMYDVIGGPVLFCHHPNIYRRVDLLFGSVRISHKFRCETIRDAQNLSSGALACPLYVQASRNRIEAMSLMYKNAKDAPNTDYMWRGEIPQILKSAEQGEENDR